LSPPPCILTLANVSSLSCRGVLFSPWVGPPFPFRDLFVTLTEQSFFPRAWFFFLADDLTSLLPLLFFRRRLSLSPPNQPCKSPEFSFFSHSTSPPPQGCFFSSFFPVTWFLFSDRLRPFSHMKPVLCLGRGTLLVPYFNVFAIFHLFLVFCPSFSFYSSFDRNFILP